MGSINRNNFIRLLIAVSFAALFVIGSLYRSSSPVVANGGEEPKPTPKKAATPRKVKYSEFPHNVKAHKVDCATCHKFPSDNWNKVRTGDAAFATGPVTCRQIEQHDLDTGGQHHLGQRCAVELIGKMKLDGAEALRPCRRKTLEERAFREQE